MRLALVLLLLLRLGRRQALDSLGVQEVTRKGREGWQGCSGFGRRTGLSRVMPMPWATGGGTLPVQRLNHFEQGYPGDSNLVEYCSRHRTMVAEAHLRCRPFAPVLSMDVVHGLISLGVHVGQRADASQQLPSCLSLTPDMLHFGLAPPPKEGPGGRRPPLTPSQGAIEAILMSQ